MIDLEKAFQIINEKLELWLRELVRILPNLALAIVLLVIGMYICKWLRNLSKKLIFRLREMLPLPHYSPPLSIFSC